MKWLLMVSFLAYLMAHPEASWKSDRSLVPLSILEHAQWPLAVSFGALGSVLVLCTHDLLCGNAKLDQSTSRLDVVQSYVSIPSRLNKSSSHWASKLIPRKQYNTFSHGHEWLDVPALTLILFKVNKQTKRQLIRRSIALSHPPKFRPNELCASQVSKNRASRLPESRGYSETVLTDLHW